MDFNAIINLGVVGVGLLVGALLRAKVRILQRFLIPSAIIGGFFLLIFYNFIAPLIGLEADGGTVTVLLAVPDHRKGTHDLAPLIALLIDVAVLIDPYLQPFGKCIYNGSTHTVESSGHLISTVSELSSCMKDGKYHLYRRLSGLFLDIHGDTAAVVLYGDGIVLVDGHCDGIAETGQSLIHAIVDDLIYHMMKAGNGCGSDVHTGTLSDCLQSLQDLDLGSVILVLVMTVVHFKFLFF